MFKCLVLFFTVSVSWEVALSISKIPVLPTLPTHLISKHWPTAWPVPKNNTKGPKRDNHLCLLNLPQSPHCISWRVVPVIIFNNPHTAKSNLLAVKKFLNTTVEYCAEDSSLMPFLPSEPNDSCIDYLFGDSPNITKRSFSWWLDSLSVEDVLVTKDKEGVNIFQDLLMTMYSCNSAPLNNTTAGALYIFHDFKCGTLLETSTFYNETETVLFDMSYSKFVTTVYGLGHFNIFGRTCTRVILFICSLVFPRQICNFKFYSNLTQFTDDAPGQHSCAAPAPTNSTVKTIKKINTALILEITLPSLLAIALVASGLIIIIRNQSRRTWFKFWWEHTRGDSTIYGQHLNHNEFFEMARKKNDPWEIDPKHLVVNDEDLLGQGAFAVVFRGLLKDSVPLLNVNASITTQVEGKISGGYEVAVKRLPNHADNQAKRDFLNEMTFMKSLGYHNHIMCMLGCISHPLSPMLVVEYCHFGDLLQFLRKNNSENSDQSKKMALSTKDLLSFSWQICDGMVYLSSHNFIHRDLAARNILLTKKLVAKIGDFGLCREMVSALYSTQGGRLPIKWMALESLKHYEYTAKSDVWSFGVLLHEIFTFGEGPYQAVQPMDMIAHLEAENRLQKVESCPEPIYEIMKACWKKEPDDRPEFKEIRDSIGKILNEQDAYYGYISLKKTSSIEVLE